MIRFCSWRCVAKAVSMVAAGLAPLLAHGSDHGLPQLRKQGAAAQLVVDGQPLVMLSGELHNSSSSSLEYMRPIWPRLTALNLNTVIASISWELVEPREGHFDFALVDGLITEARRHNLKLVFIWFATWKNGDGAYVPAWVKTNWSRFPRCHHRPGVNTTQLTALSEENCAADARAFAAVMKHIREVDAHKHTVVMVQVENEAGVRPVARDHCPLAEQAFAGPVPRDLMKYLMGHKDALIPDAKEIWGKGNFRESGTWSEVFGEDADEVFSAWHIARYIGRVAAAGKSQYPLPMYANAWLVQQKGQKAGQYPSGGPVAKMMDVWRAAAPAIDLLAPDIYLDDFKAVCAEYTQSGNPLFIPEASRDERAGLRAYYALGHHHALGFAPFGIDSLPDTNVLREHYAVLKSLHPLLARHQGKETLHGFLQYKDEKRVEFEIGDFRADIEYRPENSDGKPGAGLVVALAPDTFVMAGVNYSIRFPSRRDKPGATAWLSIEEGWFRDDQWRPGRRLNGDEASYRVSLGSTPRILMGKVYRFPN
jgi:beta-galactosidase GanA